MATLSSIPTLAGEEIVRVLITVTANNVTRLNGGNATQEGDAAFIDSELRLDGFWWLRHDRRGDIRLRRSGGSFAAWRKTQDDPTNIS